MNWVTINSVRNHIARSERRAAAQYAAMTAGQLALFGGEEPANTFTPPRGPGRCRECGWLR